MNDYNPEFDFDRYAKEVVIDYDVYGPEFLLRRRKKDKKKEHHTYKQAKLASDKWMGWKK